MSEVVSITPTALVNTVESSVVVDRPGKTSVAQQVMPSSVVVLGGVPGRAGQVGPVGPAGGTAVVRTAGETISALRAVYEEDGEVFVLDYRDQDHIDQLLGITLNAGASGAPITVQRILDITDAAWAWTPGRVYLGADGALTQTPPSTGFHVLIGAAVSATRITLNLQDPISI